MMVENIKIETNEKKMQQIFKKKTCEYQARKRKKRNINQIYIAAHLTMNQHNRGIEWHGIQHNQR